MKKVWFVFFAPLLVFLWTGCASAGKAALLSQHDTIALVSVAANQDINWLNEDSTDPGTAGPFVKRALRANPDNAIVSNAGDLMNRAEAIIRENMGSTGVINLADKDTVLNSRAYQEARINKYQINQEMVKPGDYQFIDYRDKNFPPALAAETGIQRSMFVEFNFTKSMATGAGKFGTCRANVTMNVLILDAQGKTLYRTTVSLSSGSTIKVSNGVYSQSGMTGLFESAITDACYEFLDNLAN